MHLVGENPYLQEFLSLGEDTWGRYAARSALVKKYSWAVPDDKAIHILSRYPVTEVGAGKGYWAGLAAAHRGADIQAYDVRYPLLKPNSYVDGDPPWFPVKKVDKAIILQAVKKAAEQKRALFFCWPEYDKPWAHQYLETFIKHGGRRVIYVGEGSGGCCADDAFHELLDQYQVVETHDIPRWAGINDYLQVVEI